jgi:CubicO group peptidase (beta-lactamase class C family)
MAGRPLEFDPGTQTTYSNFGYLVLGRIIEKASGRSYEDYVKAEILEPLGITDNWPCSSTL